MRTVLYVCVHNAGRSQMAEAFTNHLAKGRGIAVRALSAGTIVGTQINPVAVAAMQEVGISLLGQHPNDIDNVSDDFLLFHYEKIMPEAL